MTIISSPVHKERRMSEYHSDSGSLKDMAEKSINEKKLKNNYKNNKFKNTDNQSKRR